MSADRVKRPRACAAVAAAAAAAGEGGEDGGGGGGGGGGAGGGAPGGKAEVGRMVDCSQADDRRLIRLVRARRLLFARNNMPVASYYTQVKNLWDDVAREMGWSVADVRRKWSHIRNSYSRHLRNELHGACTSKGRMVSRWYLADELEFLREHMATDMRPAPFSSFAPTLLDLDAPEPDVKPLLQGAWFPLPAPSPQPDRKPSSLHNDDSCGSTFSPDENTSYFQFFRGIYNDYQELPPKKQRLFKRKCVNLLHELLDDEESHLSIVDSTYHQDSVLNLSSSGHASEDDREQKPGVDECYILSTH